MNWQYGRPDPPSNGQSRQALLQRLAQVLQAADPSLSQLASWSTELYIDPRLSMAPGAGPFYRTVAELILARYGLKGSVGRAIAGEEPAKVSEALVLDAMTRGQMADQARALLDLVRLSATQAQRPAIEQIQQALQAERANFREAQPLILALLGPDADAVRQRVLQQLIAQPVQIRNAGGSSSLGR